jgi:hypothetical protein
LELNNEHRFTLDSLNQPFFTYDPEPRPQDIPSDESSTEDSSKDDKIAVEEQRYICGACTIMPVAEEQICCRSLTKWQISHNKDGETIIKKFYKWILYRENQVPSGVSKFPKHL